MPGLSELLFVLVDQFPAVGAYDFARCCRCGACGFCPSEEYVEEIDPAENMFPREEGGLMKSSCPLRFFPITCRAIRFRELLLGGSFFRSYPKI